MKVNQFYNTYWNKKNRLDTFWEYERNHVLPKLFEKSEYILDLACGDGAVSEFLKNKMKKEVLSADFSDDALKKAKSRGLKTVKINVEEKFDLKSASFDTVFWGDNIEHLFNPEFTLSEIKRVLKKDGRLIFSCPNMGYWRYRLYYLINGSLADSEWSGNKPWSWLHIRFFNYKILKEMLEKNGFSIVSIRAVSKRFPDKILLNTLFPRLFGMILVIEAKK